MNKSLKKLVAKKTKELQDMNIKLEERVKNEVEKNLRKDTILSKQSKFAAMGEMIQNIAHQWRQPLSIISTGASGLKLQKELNGKIDDELLNKTLSSIVDTSMHLSNTIDDFMYFFKPNKNKIIFKLSSAFDKTFNIFDPKIQNGKIKIIKNIEDIELNSFKSELIQVFINIMNNSKDALDDTSFEDKFIFIDVKMDFKNVIIELKDNAGGIDEQIIGKVFEPYFTTKHKFQGTGIGLYMCQEIVDKHMDGIIEVFNTTYKYKNIEYKGAKFIITLNC
jgi:signal transduction histidine kinase